MAKRWKPQDVTYLKRYAKNRLVTELAERFKTKPEEVEKKLKELVLTSKDGKGVKPRIRDPLVDEFEAGLEAIDQGKYRDAKKHFNRVIEETTDIELAGRARLYLRVCEQKTQKKDVTGAEEPFLEAVFERNLGNFDAALEMCSRDGRQSKDDRFAYLAASIYALMDDNENAVKFLTMAIELNPKNRIHAFHDTDFEVLRSDPELKQLFF